MRIITYLRALYMNEKIVAEITIFELNSLYFI